MYCRICALIVLICVNELSAIKKPKTRIIGGVNTNIKNYPFAISIFSHGTHMCGGVLIRTSWILTAAHCLVMATECHMKLRNPKFYEVLAGSSRVDKHRNGQMRECGYFIMHPDYDPKTLKNDIALIRVLQPFQLSNTVALADISDYFATYEDMSDEVCAVAGWGLMGADERSTAPLLQHTWLDVVPQAECREKLEGYELADNDMCLQSASTLGSCYGDSGGPVVCENGKVEALVSGSVGDFDCALPGLPYLFVRIKPYQAWTRETMLRPPDMPQIEIIFADRSECHEHDNATGFLKPPHTNRGMKYLAELCTVHAVIAFIIVLL